MMYQATWKTANKSAINNILKTTTHSLKNMEKNYKKTYLKNQLNLNLMALK